MNWLARWLFRRLVEKRIIGFIYVGEHDLVPGMMLPPGEVEAVFRD